MENQRKFLGRDRSAFKTAEGTAAGIDGLHAEGRAAQINADGNQERNSRSFSKQASNWWSRQPKAVMLTVLEEAYCWS